MRIKEAVDRALKLIASEGFTGLECEAGSLPALLVHFDSEVPTSLLPQVAAELRRQKLVDVTKNKKRLRVQPSVKGIHRLQRSELDYITIRPLAHWDKTWRMVTYDVPRAQSAKRLVFTRQLQRLGFTMVRESVWFHPQPCFEAVADIVAYCGLQRHVTYAEIGRLDGNTVEKLRRAYPELT